ncbi:Imm10 family immunity protein [Uliginosibacterium gangwonense]|uniref:Imm10 family immunity protein n=1 Tax=Uliginosibacterium gangwonense TaxID=392736 RepID=UPI00037F072B|nr:Imm10 family immunity protein [Uliginosibacterium gangwonense]
MKDEQVLRPGSQGEMTVRFDAGCVTVTDEEDAWLVCFADQAVSPVRYFLLQRAHEFDAQDIQFDMATYHVERDDQSQSCYGGIAVFDLYRDRVVVRLNVEGSQSLETLGLDVQFALDDTRFECLRQQLERIFAGTSCLVIHG